MPTVDLEDYGFDELADGYLRPDYDGYCFSGVPATVGSILDAEFSTPLPNDVFEGVDTDVSSVLVVLVDALGFEQFERHRDEISLLRRFTERGAVTPLTAMYPSETAACVTTMHTGRRPVEHGMLGWTAYDPGTDVVYDTLPYRATDGGDLSLPPADLFDSDTVYRRLGDGVDCHVVEPDYGPGYGDAATVGATVHHYDGTAEFALATRDVLQKVDNPSYTYAYYPTLDAVAHESGPGSERCGTQVAEVCNALERAFAAVDDETAAETLVCLVADHGQVPVDDPTLLENVGGLASVPTDRSGTPLVLGGPRNVHLRTDDPEGVRERVNDLDALVFSKADALAEGLWGTGDPGSAFERNCGDLVVVPREQALWHSNDPDELSLAGMHGGLNPAEALVPFCTALLSDLQ